MAGITTWNKATVFTGTDPWNLTVDTKKAIDTSGLVFGVASLAERNGLAALAPGGVLPIPTMIFRADLGSYETWDGTVWRGRQHTEFTTATNTAATATSWGMGTFTRDTANSNDSAFVTINGIDSLRVRDAGLYAVTVMVSFTTAISGISWLSADGVYTVTMGGGLQNFIATIPAWNLTAGQIINPLLAHGSGVNKDFTSRVRVTKVG